MERKTMTTNTRSLGYKLDPILIEIEQTLWEQEACQPNTPKDFPETSLRAACKIFMATMLDFTYKKNLEDKLTMQQHLDRADALGVRIRHLVFEFAGKDSLRFYDKQN